eukprot:jgi/Tetstr1/442719/TSEL_030809.t1
MASIRGAYEEMGVQQYYEARGGEYSNPHFSTLKEVLPRALEQLLGPLLPLRHGLLDFCCGSGEFTRIFEGWQASRGRDVCTAITGADPYTQEGYRRATSRRAESWSFEDVCEGALEDAGVSFDVIAISYAIHLLERSRYHLFFHSLARRAAHMLIVSPTKNKGIVGMEHGWEEVAYVSDLKK